MLFPLRLSTLALQSRSMKRTTALRLTHPRSRSRWLALLCSVLALALSWPLPAAAWLPPNSPPGPYRTFLPVTDVAASARQRQNSLLPADQARSYVLKDGDNLAELALELGRDVAAMACVTPSSTYPLSELRPGQTILVPSAQYICHTVQPGETLAHVAAAYQVTATAIVETPWNELASVDAALEPGRRLLIFDGVRPEVAGPRQSLQPAVASPASEQATTTPAQPAQPTPVAQDAGEVWPYGDGRFIWPVEGVISQNFSGRHRGLDIAADFGVDVLAADNGVVAKAGWSDLGYGLRVIIDHNIDYITLYGHLSEILVEEGQVVEKGQLIGRIGSTGNSTGPHLHLELRDFGYLIDPLRLLPDR